jgi:hypothetical protein
MSGKLLEMLFCPALFLEEFMKYGFAGSPTAQRGKASIPAHLFRLVDTALSNQTL